MLNCKLLKNIVIRERAKIMFHNMGILYCSINIDTEKGRPL